MTWSPPELAWPAASPLPDPSGSLVRAGPPTGPPPGGGALRRIERPAVAWPVRTAGTTKSGHSSGTAPRAAARWRAGGRSGATPAPPDAERVRALLAASQAAGDPLHALWVTAAATGARVGELTAVRWRDLTLDGPTGRGALRIERTLLTVRAGQPVFGPPKTEAGRREVALLPPAVATLRALRAARSAEALQTRGRRPTGDALVFLGARGGALDRKAVARALARAWDRAGGRRNHGWRFHDLRHYSATRMLEAHVEPQTVAAVLGHSRVSTTLDLYAHPRPERVELAVDALAAALAGAAPAAGGAG
ncbi:MAG TPA: site-specific integrase [Chloroflexota bacterium]|nr:site-specific integrase [Chloroflexota bacterium]